MDRKKTAPICFRLAKRWEILLRERAEREGVTVSSFIYELLKRHLLEDKKDA